MVQVYSHHPPDAFSLSPDCACAPGDGCDPCHPASQRRLNWHAAHVRCILDQQLSCVRVQQVYLSWKATREGDASINKEDSKGCCQGRHLPQFGEVPPRRSTELDRVATMPLRGRAGNWQSDTRWAFTQAGHCHTPSELVRCLKFGSSVSTCGILASTFIN